MKNKKWFWVSIAALMISFLSLVFPVIFYVTANGITYRFYIMDLIINSSLFYDVVLYDYIGPVFWDIGEGTLILLCVIVMIAVLCACIGIFTLRQQYPNKIQFILTILGLIGTTIPSLVEIVVVLFPPEYFNGTIKCGVAPIVTPIAMIVCICAVMRRKSAVEREAKSRGLVRQAGDL